MGRQGRARKEADKEGWSSSPDKFGEGEKGDKADNECWKIESDSVGSILASELRKLD